MLWVILLCMLFATLEAVDDKIVKEYSKRFSFSRTLDRKMQYYPDVQVSWLKFYMNLALPAVAVFSTIGAYNAYQQNELLSFPFLAAAVFAALAVSNCILFRALDGTSFVLNIVALAAFIAKLLVDLYPWDLSWMTILLWLLIVGGNLLYFWKKRELFFSSEQELKDKYALL